MKKECSIVIRAYNEEKHLGRLLSGIRQQTIKDIQIILVDSGSVDNTVKIAEGSGAQIVTIKPQEFTFGRSLNLGIEAAKSNFIVMASAHVFPVYPDWLERILEPFSDESVAVVYGKQSGSESSHFSEKQIFANWYGNVSTKAQTHPFCNNANSAIRRKLWEKHLYDENLPGLEDLEWAQWAMDQKFKIAYSAEAEIIHVHEESWKGIHNRYMREGMAFKQIYPHEQFHLSDMFKLFFQNTLNDIGVAKKQGAIRREILNIIRFRWLQFLGTYQGYKRSGELTWQLKQSFYYPKNHHEKQRAYSRAVDPIKYD